jgi:hypothetical protein
MAITGTSGRDCYTAATVPPTVRSSDGSDNVTVAPATVTTRATRHPTGPPPTTWVRCPTCARSWQIGASIRSGHGRS